MLHLSSKNFGSMMPHLWWVTFRKWTTLSLSIVHYVKVNWPTPGSYYQNLKIYQPTCPPCGAQHRLGRLRIVFGVPFFERKALPLHCVMLCKTNVIQSYWCVCVPILSYFNVGNELKYNIVIKLENEIHNPPNQLKVGRK